MSYLPCLEVDANVHPGRPADAAVIWLHGLGADGHDFEPVVPELRLPDHLRVRFLFPHAPSIPVTVNGGVVMPAWYDILEMDIDRKLDEEQLLDSVSQVAALVEREIERGIASHRIVIAGFSQGGAVAYQLALTFPQKLAGLIALSTYFATAGSVQRHPASGQLPILIGHGEYDPVVPEELGQRAVQALRGMGFTPEYHTWPMDHAVSREEIHTISAWLQRVLGSGRD